MILGAVSCHIAPVLPNNSVLKTPPGPYPGLALREGSRSGREPLGLARDFCPTQRRLIVAWGPGRGPEPLEPPPPPPLAYALIHPSFQNTPLFTHFYVHAWVPCRCGSRRGSLGGHTLVGGGAQ